jgi:hypothetical protein
MGRALRYDGVIPTKLDVANSFSTFTAAEIRDLVRYEKDNRSESSPFDIIIEGVTPLEQPDEWVQTAVRSPRLEPRGGSSRCGMYQVGWMPCAGEYTKARRAWRDVRRSSYAGVDLPSQVPGNTPHRMMRHIRRAMSHATTPESCLHWTRAGIDTG